MKLIFTDQYANLFLLLNGLAILFYLGATKKNRQRAMKFGNYETLQKVAGKNFLKSSNIMLIIRLLALTLLIVGISNPVLVRDVPSSNSDYVIAVDSSSSMLSSDLNPTRFDASKRISQEFVRGLGNKSSVGVVSFSGEVTKDQEMTDDRTITLSSIDSISIGSTAGTAIGDALSVSISMLAGRERGKEVILITDGRNNVGGSVSNALNLAKSQNVTINPVGIGEKNTSVSDFEIVDGNNASRAVYPNLNVTQLETLADETGGEFTTAANNTALQDALIDLEESEQRDDFSQFFIVGAAVLLLLEWLLGNTKYSIIP